MFQYKILVTKMSLLEPEFLTNDVCPQCLADTHSLYHMFLRACSTSRNSGTRNSGTRNSGTAEHHGTSRNNPEQPKNPEHPPKTRNTPKKTRNTPRKPGTPPKKPGTPPKKPGTPRKKTRNLKKQITRQYVTARVSFSNLPPLIAHKII